MSTKHTNKLALAEAITEKIQIPVSLQWRGVAISELTEEQKVRAIHFEVKDCDIQYAKKILNDLYHHSKTDGFPLGMKFRFMPMFANIPNTDGQNSLTTMVGFIDGTMHCMCQPSFFQRLLYSGHKHHHGIKFQSVVTPDGLIAYFFGPIPASRHDSYMLAESNLLLQLQQQFHHQPPYALYGDAAYGTSQYCFRGFPSDALIHLKGIGIGRCLECMSLLSGCSMKYRINHATVSPMLRSVHFFATPNSLNKTE
jgi:hypothetical protein